MSSAGSGHRKRPTIRDVAAAAGVSKSLVSRAFVNPEKVGAQSLERIMSNADRLGFRPSWSARALNSADGGFIGIVVSDLYSAALAPIVIGAYRQLKASGHEVLLTTASLSEPGADCTLEDAQIAFIHDLRPSSLLIVGAVRDMQSLERLAEQVPTVVAGSRNVDLPVAAEVFTDDDAGMDEVITHLVGLGHRHIAHIAGIGRVGEGRSVAYRSAMTGHGLGGFARVVPGDFEEHAGYLAACELLDSDDPPTAITTAGDPAGVGALAAVRESGADVAVVGYGNAPVANYRLVQLTTVDPDNQKIGASAASALLRAEAGDDAARQIRISPRLVVRSSAVTAHS